MFRWGIMGGGFISSQFAKGLEEVAYAGGGTGLPVRKE